MSELKDILLIGDIFVSNILHKRKAGMSNVTIKEEKYNRFLPEAAFDDSFVDILKNELNHDLLANKIETLFFNTINSACLHLGTALCNNKLTYDTIDCSLMHREKLIDFLKNRKYLFIGISTSFTLEDGYIKELVDLIYSYTPDSKVVIGGMYIIKMFKLLSGTELLDKIKMMGADYYVFNEIGEDALVSIINYSKNHNANLKNIANIAFKDNGTYKINSYIVNDINKSVTNWTLEKKTDCAFIRTSVGCMFNCKFCDFPSIADKYRSKNTETIIKELDLLNGSEIKHVLFLDDTFNVPIKNFKNILNLIIEKSFRFKWISFARCQYIDDETAYLMKKSGCIGVFLGLESGNNEVLQNMNKKATVDKYFEGISNLNKYDIPTYGTFVIGFPGENCKSIEDTINLINNIKLTYYRLFRWVYHGLSPIAKEKEKYSLEVAPKFWKHNSMNSDEALEACLYIAENVKNAIHCTLPFAYTFYLNDDINTKQHFNNCLKLYNEKLKFVNS